MAEEIKVVGDIIRFDEVDCARISPNIKGTVKQHFIEALHEINEPWDPAYVKIHMEATVQELTKRFTDDREDNAGLFTPTEIAHVLREYFEEVLKNV